MNRLTDISKILISGEETAQEFKYTTDKGCLTLEQRKFYEENGYLVIRNFLKNPDIEKWRARFL